jgi:type II secretory pathway pseudopilin PulG
MKITHALRHSGFTLVELMVAATASLIVIGVTISSIVTLQQMNQALEDRLAQEADIQRSLHFMASDVQEGKSIEAGATERTNYLALFRIIRPDKSTVEYYTAAKGDRHPWAGPQIIFRRDSLEKRMFALVDQISVQPPQNCFVKDKTKEILVSNGVGFSVVITSKSKATICMRGHLLNSPEGMEESIQAVTRAGQ